MERIEFFPEPKAYFGWISEIVDFIHSKGGPLAFGVENYKGDLEFFTADGKEEYPMIFLTKFAPHELVFFGADWIVSISSYPEHEYSSNLEYSIRLYGAASVIGTKGGGGELTGSGWSDPDVSDKKPRGHTLDN